MAVFYVWQSWSRSSPAGPFAGSPPKCALTKGYHWDDSGEQAVVVRVQAYAYHG
jgi:hypothetical protein